MKCDSLQGFNLLRISLKSNIHPNVLFDFEKNQHGRCKTCHFEVDTNQSNFKIVGALKRCKVSPTKKVAFIKSYCNKNSLF